MKLRIKGNSIRMRLSQAEVKTLQKSGEVWDSTHFPSAKALKYGVVVTSSPDLNVQMDECNLRMEAPTNLLEKWFDPSEVTIKGIINLQNSDQLLVLIEKDFRCLTTRPGEDESDLFPNPQERHG